MHRPLDRNSALERYAGAKPAGRCFPAPFGTLHPYLAATQCRVGEDERPNYCAARREEIKESRIPKRSVQIIANGCHDSCHMRVGLAVVCHSFHLHGGRAAPSEIEGVRN